MKKEILEELDQKKYLFGAVFYLANKLQQLGDQFDERITLKQWRVLSAIGMMEQDGASIGETAELCSSSGQNVKKIAVILEKKGYVQIKQDELDARFIRMHLTEEASHLFQGREEMEKKFFDALFAGMDDKMVDGFYRGMKKWYENMETMQANGELRKELRIGQK